MGQDASEVVRDALIEVFKMAQQMPAMPPSGAQAFASAAAPAPAPAPPWHAWACLTSCIVMLILSFIIAVAYLDMRSEMRDKAAQQANDLREARNDIKAIRAYINAGLVPGKGK